MYSGEVLRLTRDPPPPYTIFRVPLEGVWLFSPFRFIVQILAEKANTEKYKLKPAVKKSVA